MDLEPDAVPEPVAERRAELGGLDRPARRRRRRPARAPGATAARPASRRSRQSGSRTAARRPRRRRTSSCSRAVAVEDAAGVDRHEDASSIGRRPGRRAARSRLAGRDDGRERPPRRPPPPEAPLDPPRELALGASRRASLASAAKIVVGEGPARAHARDLVRVLHGAQRLDEPARRDGVDPGLRERPVPLVRQVLLLERDPAPGEARADRWAGAGARSRRSSTPSTSRP